MRLVSDKMLYLSSGAAECLGARVELFGRDGVTALVSAPEGQYHLCRKSDSCKGKNLCCAELTEWLCNKYKLSIGEKISAWTPLDGDGILFFGEGLTTEESRYGFDERFKPVELSYHKRYGHRVFIEDNCISFTAELRQQLPQRLALYHAGEALALVGENDGPYRVEYRGNRKREAIYSAQLANYCKAKFGGEGRSILLSARPIEKGLIFGASEYELSDRPMQRLDLGAPENCFVRPLKNGALYLSSEAVEQLGECFSLYTSGNFLAFHGDSNGPLCIRRTGYQNLLHSASVRRLVTNTYPNSKRLYLIPMEDLMVLSPLSSRVPLPSRSAFQKVETARSPSHSCVKQTSKAPSSLHEYAK